MTDQLWALIGAAVGIAGTGGVGWFRDAANSRRADAISRRQDNRELCTDLLELVEATANSTIEFEEQHGMLPSDMNYEWSAGPMHAKLTQVEVHCPKPVHSAATRMVDALDQWIFMSGQYGTYREARASFIEMARTKV